VADRESDEARWSAWLTLAQGGDQDAYGALLTELSAVIRAYLLAKFGALQNLDDCVQESLLALHQARHTYDAARPFRPWLFAIARNRTIDALRQSRRQQDLVAGDRGEDVTTVESLAAIDTGRLLGSLSKNLRDTLIMTKILGYSTRECAHLQGVSESVVKVRVHRGLRKLRSLCNLEVD